MDIICPVDDIMVVVSLIFLNCKRQNPMCVFDKHREKQRFIRGRLHLMGCYAMMAALKQNIQGARVQKS
jgi:hypothetical protein